jgi:hypothetical protein
MKKLLIITILLLNACQLFSQAPELNYYSQLGFGAGLAIGKEKSGLNLQLFHGTVIGNYWFYEGSAGNLAFFNEGSSKSKITTLELATIDMGFGYTSDNIMLGVSPFSINWTLSASYGIAMLGKFRILKNYVFETKLEPHIYGKQENYGLFNNNFYVGMQYWFSDYFSIGLRYYRYDYLTNYNLMLSWNLL